MILPKGTIIFEGISGGGKSTQLDLLKQRRGDKYVFCDCSSPIYERTKGVRNYLGVNSEYLMAESLLHQFTNWMKFYEQKGQGVFVVDRFVLSNLVYFLARAEVEGVRVDVSRARDYFLRPFGVGSLEDSLTLLFDCPIDVARERLKNRVRCGFDFDLQKRAGEIYLRELELYPYASKIIDGGESKEDVFKKVLEELK